MCAPVCPGTIELNVSWKRLTKDPIDVLIDEVFIVVGPDLREYTTHRYLPHQPSLSGDMQ